MSAEGSPIQDIAVLPWGPEVVLILRRLIHNYNQEFSNLCFLKDLDKVVVHHNYLASLIAIPVLVMVAFGIYVYSKRTEKKCKYLSMDIIREHKVAY